MDLVNPNNVNAQRPGGIAENRSHPADKNLPTKGDFIDKSNLRLEHLDKVTRQNTVRVDAKKASEDSLSAEKLQEIADKLNEALPSKEISLQFEVDTVLDRPIISVLDAESGEVLRQVPSREILRAIHNIDAMRGVIFDELS